VNPLAEHRKLPPGDPIPAAHLARFALERDRAGALFLGTPVAGASLADANGRATPRAASN
jgi:hypothetical protein